ncbi:uncharacterized protein FIBRA_00368 [Fibroporia radiculosa]|uniref:Aminoglycoside phosphotransferase domain-containing protein n=1 Tax=Fibroporia radiculosa TaxID=599839 RepID=J7SCS3_9APHY|nr:uncharacterized protein FIBRA_00368 [Fibroporia radiculosa]CCL98373.1 predicted protein [Fibroporia radiculosa]
MAETRYQRLNNSTARMLSKALEEDPAGDLEPLLHKLCATYPKLRCDIAERHKKKRMKLATQEEEQKQKQKQKWKAFYLESLPFPLPPCAIVFPPSSYVRELLGVADKTSPSCLSEAVVHHVAHGRTIWEGLSRSVVQLGDVAVKVGSNIEHDEHELLRYLEEHLPDLPAPRALGLLTVGRLSYFFMSYVPGNTLEQRWPSLSSQQKMDIRSSLNSILAKLRSVELSPGAPFGSLAGLRLCKDLRMDITTSSVPIYNEADFNDFLLSRTSSRAAQGYRRWLRSLTKDDHRIVLTHGDFHPRNIMVTDDSSGRATVSGIIDWEACGFYPEYWELLKALNTRAVVDTSDWWDHLPKCILGYEREIAVDHLVEQGRI